jgi:hypothetical protein
MPTATNSLMGSIPQDDAGVGWASNVVAIQAGDATGTLLAHAARTAFMSGVEASMLASAVTDHATLTRSHNRHPSPARHAARGTATNSSIDGVENIRYPRPSDVSRSRTIRTIWTPADAPTPHVFG